MSNNLHIQVDDVELDLYQTPTYITNMCMVNSKGSVALLLVGKKARRAIQAYCM